MAYIEELLFGLQGIHAFLVALPALMVCAAIFVIKYDAPYSQFPLLGYEGGWTYKKSKDRFLAEGKKLLFDGARLKRPFQVIMPGGPVVVLPSSYVNEIKNDKRLSFNQFIKKDLFPTYPGFEGARASLTNHVLQDTVRIRLTQSLNLITQDLCEETEFATSKMFGESEEWKEISMAATVPSYVARLSSRVFLGVTLARDEAWLPVAVNYTIDLAQAARVLRLWPSVLRPIVHWFLPECKALRKRSAQAHEIIGNEVERRRTKWETDAAQGKKVSKTADSLGWMQEISKEQGVTDFDTVGGQLGLTFAAIHTTSDLLSKCLIRLANTPQYQMQLREEMHETLRSEGAIKKTTLYQMKLLDSFMKEVQRTEPAGLTLINRVPEERVTLKDGTILEKGMHVKIVNDGAFDDANFASATEFDPARFLKLRSQPGQENNWQFVTTTPEILGFGHGMHACPGRFFASNEVKIALCWLLLKYDWKVKKGEEPVVLYYGGEVMAHPSNKIMLRRRKEEINLADLYEAA